MMRILQKHPSARALNSPRRSRADQVLSLLGFLLATLAVPSVWAQGKAVQIYLLADGTLNRPVRMLESGETVDLSLMGTKLNIALEVDTSKPIDRVEISAVNHATGVAWLRTDSVHPYTLYDESHPTMLPVGDYTFTTTVFDGTFDPPAESDPLSLDLVVTDNLVGESNPPQVILFSPKEGQKYSDGRPYVSVLAKDDQAIAKVEYLIENASGPVATHTEYFNWIEGYEWRMHNGQQGALSNELHWVRARVFDTSENVTTTPWVSFTVDANRQPIEDIAVNLAEPTWVRGKSKIGFNHGIQRLSPGSVWLEDVPLDIGVTREGGPMWGALSYDNRVADLGADFFALSYPIGYDWWCEQPKDVMVTKCSNGLDHGDESRPYDPFDLRLGHDFTHYNLHLEAMFAEVRDDFELDFEETIFEVWNEAALGGWGDGAKNFQGSQGQFFATMDEWHDTLRAAAAASGVTDLQLAAPGHGTKAAFNPLEIEAMMDHLLKGDGINPRTLEVLTLHHLTLDNRFDLARDTLTHYQERYLGPQSPFAAVGLDRIVLNEYVTPDLHYLPSTVLFYPYLLENLNIDGGALTCDNSATGSDCFAGDLLDMLTPNQNGTLGPRPIWWVFKAYSERLPQGVEVTADHFGKIIALASTDATAIDTNRVQVLLGWYEALDPTNPDILSAPQTTKLLLNDLDTLFAVNEVPELTIERIPYENSISAKEILQAPEPLVEGTDYHLDQQPLNGTMEVTLDVAPHAVYIVTVKLEQP